MKTLKFRKLPNCVPNTLRSDDSYYVLWSSNKGLEYEYISGEDLKRYIQKKFEGFEEIWIKNGEKVVGYMPCGETVHRIIKKEYTDIPEKLYKGSYYMYRQCNNCYGFEMLEVPEDIKTVDLKYNSGLRKYSFDKDFYDSHDLFKILAIIPVDTSRVYDKVKFLDDGYSADDETWSDHYFKCVTRKEILDAVKNAYKKAHERVSDNRLLNEPSEKELNSLVSRFFKVYPYPSGNDAEEYIRDFIINRPFEISVTLRPGIGRISAGDFAGVMEYGVPVKTPKFRPDAY